MASSLAALLHTNFSKVNPKRLSIALYPALQYRFPVASQIMVLVSYGLDTTKLMLAKLNCSILTGIILFTIVMSLGPMATRNHSKHIPKLCL